MSSKNAEIKAAIDSFDLSRARELLREAMPEANADTFYLASRAALDDEQRTEFLERAVALDPFHEAARTALRQMKVPQSASAAPAPAPVAAPSAPASAPSEYVKQLGVHHFRADIPIASDANLKLIEEFFVGLGYKRSGELAFTRRVAFIGGSFRVKVSVLPGSVSVTAECDLPRRTKHLADIVTIDATLRAELDDLAATLVGGKLTTERAVQAQVNLEQSIQQARKEWIKEQNSPAQIIVALVFLVLFILFMVWLSGGGLAVFF